MDIKTNIAKTIRQLYSISLNHWVSVREHSITQIMESNGVNRRYTGSLSSVLKSAGLMFTEGEKGYMRYKFNEIAVLDADHLAEMVIEIQRKSQSEYRASRPKRNKSPKPYGSEKGKTSTLKKEPLALGTKVYFIYENKITEGIVYAAKLSETPGKLYEYTIKTTLEVGIRLLNNLTLFLKPEEVTSYLMKNMVKYDTELVAQEIVKQHESTQSL